MEMEILGKESGRLINVAVEMGKVRFGLEVVGGEEGGLEEGRFLSGPDGGKLDIQPVSVGNPHCVTFRESLSEDDLSRLGPFLTGHPAFPQGTNVQLARVVDEGRVEILIWERGVGRTSSSGTSACAVAAASWIGVALTPWPKEMVAWSTAFHCRQCRPGRWASTYPS